MSWEFVDRPYYPGNPPFDYLIAAPTRIPALWMLELGFGSDPADNDDWPIFEGVRPDTPDKCFMIFETTGVEQGRHMIGGGRVHKYGFNIQLRTLDYENSFPIRQLADAFQQTSGNFYKKLPHTLTTGIGLGHVLIQNIQITSGPIHIGLEKESSRHLYSLNILMALDIFLGE